MGSEQVELPNKRVPRRMQHLMMKAHPVAKTANKPKTVASQTRVVSRPRVQVHAAVAAPNQVRMMRQTRVLKQKPQQQAMVAPKQGAVPRRPAHVMCTGKVRAAVPLVVQQPSQVQVVHCPMVTGKVADVTTTRGGTETAGGPALSSDMLGVTPQ
jgi:hypothetical protein